MRLRKSVTFVTTAILFASMIAGPGSIGAAAAESTTADYAVSIALSDAGLSEMWRREQSRALLSMR